MLMLKLQYFGHLVGRTDSLEKTHAGKDWRPEEKGTTEDEMVGWHHRLNVHEIEQAPEVGDGLVSLACCSPWSHKESDMTELNWVTKLYPILLQPHGLQHARLPCPSPTPRAYSNSCPLCQWCSLVLCHPFLLLPSIFPSMSLFQWVSSSYQVTKVLELQHQSFQWIFRTDFLEDWLAGSLCSSRDSQKPSPTPQFKSINSSALSFLHSPTLTSIHDHWKNHSFD